MFSENAMVMKKDAVSRLFPVRNRVLFLGSRCAEGLTSGTAVVSVITNNSRIFKMFLPLGL